MNSTSLAIRLADRNGRTYAILEGDGSYFEFFMKRKVASLRTHLSREQKRSVENTGSEKHVAALLSALLRQNVYTRTKEHGTTPAWTHP